MHGLGRVLWFFSWVHGDVSFFLINHILTISKERVKGTLDWMRFQFQNIFQKEWGDWRCENRQDCLPRMWKRSCSCSWQLLGGRWSPLRVILPQGVEKGQEKFEEENRQACCSSQHQIVIWICFWFDKLNQSTNSEMAMLSKFFWSRILSGARLSCCNWCARLLLISCANMDFPLGQCTNATPKQISAHLEVELWFGEKVYTYHRCLWHRQFLVAWPEYGNLVEIYFKLDLDFILFCDNFDYHNGYLWCI